MTIQGSSQEQFNNIENFIYEEVPKSPPSLNKENFSIDTFVQDNFKDIVTGIYTNGKGPFQQTNSENNLLKKKILQIEDCESFENLKEVFWKTIQENTPDYYNTLMSFFEEFIPNTIKEINMNLEKEEDKEAIKNQFIGKLYPLSEKQRLMERIENNEEGPSVRELAKKYRREPVLSRIFNCLNCFKKKKD